MLVIEQNNIDWHHLICGHFSQRWATLQAKNAQVDPILAQQEKADLWQKNLIHLLWNHLYMAWLDHNLDEHEQTRD